MIRFQRTRRRRMLQEAEGYLELATALSEGLALAPEIGGRLAGRAIHLLEQIDDATWQRSHVLLVKGEALKAQHRWREAIDAFSESARLDPTSVQTWLSLAWCHKRAGHVGLAIEALEEALSVAPEMPIVHYNLACYWSLAKNPLLAAEYLQQALDLDSGFRDLIGGEPDFDPIRRHPAFLAVTTIVV